MIRISRQKIIISLLVSFAYSNHACAVSEHTESISAYQENIQKLESEYGVYDAQLGEQLLGLGLVYQLENQHEQATDVLTRALQIKRINNGLYDLGQVAILEKVIKSNIETEDWLNVDRHYQQILWIHKRNYGETAPELLPVLDKVARWKLTAYKKRLISKDSHILLHEAAGIYSDTINILSAQYGDSDPRLINSLYGQAITNYEMAFHTADIPIGKFRQRSLRSSFQTICRPVVRSNGQVTQNCQTGRTASASYYASIQQSKEFAVGVSLRKVGKALKQINAIYEANPELSTVDHAYAMSHLGDWNLLQGRRISAHETYRKAYSMLANDIDNQQHLTRLFGAPNKIPALQIILPDLKEHQKSNDIDAYTLASFNVSRSGRPTNIKILEVHPTDKKVSHITVKKAIKARQYRPRYENGEPVDTIGHKLRVSMD